MYGMSSIDYWRNKMSEKKMAPDDKNNEKNDDMATRDNIDDAIESTVKLDITCYDLKKIISVIIDVLAGDAFFGYATIDELSADIWLGLTESGVSVENALLSVNSFKKARQEKNY